MGDEDQKKNKKINSKARLLKANLNFVRKSLQQTRGLEVFKF
jgi:hypothetical protein